MISNAAGEGPGLGAQTIRQTLIIWLALSAVFLLFSIPAIYKLDFPDPDDALRLTQVRDLIAGQAWFDLHQYRSDPAHGGVLMHWSRLVDVPLAAMILLLRPLLGQTAAELVTMAVVPMLMLGAGLFLVARLARMWLSPRTTMFACIALALSVPALQQLMPLRIDHHGWQVIAALVAVNALFATSARTGGWIVGAAMAFCLSVSLEGLPFAAALVGACALRWLRDPAERAWTVHATTAIAIVSVTLYLATRGLTDLSIYCDVVTPVHLAVLAWGAISMAALAAWNPAPKLALLGGFGAIAGVAVGIAAWGSPQCLGGSFSGLSPLTRILWYDRVHEGLPIWRQTLPVMAQIAVGALLGLQATVRLALNANNPAARRFWTEYALLLGAAIAISFMVARAGAIAGALAAVPLGWQLQAWIEAIERVDKPWRKALAGLALAIGMVPSAPLSAARLALPDGSEPGDYAELKDVSGNCALDKLPAALKALPPGLMLAPLDLGPQLLAETRMSVVATGHHRGNAAMSDVITAFLARPEVARTVVARVQADYVIECPTQVEVLNYRHLRPDGLAQVLATGGQPAWLEPVALREKTAFRVWRVKRALY